MVAATGGVEGRAVSKFIIHVADDVLDLNAADCVAAVVRQGKISNDGKSYCYITSFKTGLVVATLGTKPNGTTSFRVYRDDRYNRPDGQKEE